MSQGFIEEQDFGPAGKGAGKTTRRVSPPDNFRAVLFESLQADPLQRLSDHGLSIFLACAANESPNATLWATLPEKR